MRGVLGGVVLHVLVRGHLGSGVLNVNPCQCSYGNACHAASSFADAPARHIRPRCLACCTRVRRCWCLDSIAF